MMKMLAIVLLMTAPCLAAVQGAVNSASAAAVSVSTTSNVTSGNLLVVSSKTQSLTAATPVFTSSSGVACTWNIVATSAQVSSFFTSSLAWCVIPSTGAETITATWTGGAASFTDIGVTEYASPTTTWVASALDVTTNNLSAATLTTCSTGTTATTTSANELVVAVCDTFGSAQTWLGTVGAYTNEVASSRNTKGWFDTSVTVTGPQAFSTTINDDVFFGIIATFKQGTSSAVATPGKAVIF